MRQSSRGKTNEMSMQTRKSTASHISSQRKTHHLIKCYWRSKKKSQGEKLTVHTTGNAFSLAGSVEWSRPSNMTAAYTKIHPKAVMLLSFGLDNLIVLYVRAHENRRWKKIVKWYTALAWLSTQKRRLGVQACIAPIWMCIHAHSISECFSPNCPWMNWFDL